MEELSNKSGTRRKLLKGITATGANVIAANAVTGKAESDTKFRGVSYDTVTHMAQGASTFNLQRHQNGISGRLTFGGFNIRIGEESPLKPRGTEPDPYYELYLDSSQYRRNGLPLHVRFTDYGHFIVGSATRPDSKFSNIAFSVGEAQKGFSRNSVENGLINGGNGRKPRNLEHKPTVPANGIPKNTSLDEIARKAEVNSNG